MAFRSRPNKNVCVFYDDFVGSNYNTMYWSGRGSGGSLAAQAGGLLRVQATANNSYELYQGDKPDFSLVGHIVQTSRWRLSSLSSISGEVGMEAASPNNTTEWLCFLYASGNANWQAQISSGGNTTTVDTGVAADTSYHDFRIEFTSSLVTFFLDSVLVASIGTNITSYILQPYAYVVSTTGSARDVYIDWIEVYGGRE